MNFRNSSAGSDGSRKSSGLRSGQNSVLGAAGFSTGIDDSGEKSVIQNVTSEDDLKDQHCDSKEKIPSATELGDTSNVRSDEDQTWSLSQLHARLPKECEVCNAPCELACKGCQKAFYCSRLHQVSDWPQHKADCFPAIFIKNDVGEKILVATKGIPAGGTILKEKPLILLPSTTEPADHICLGCYEEVETSVSCSKCKWDICSSKCEKVILIAVIQLLFLFVTFNYCFILS